MNISIFGSSILSAYWNGAATYYRGIVRALASRGHQIDFYEPDAYNRQKHRDIEPPDWVSVHVFEPTEKEASRLIDESAKSDLLIKTSGVGVLDGFLEQAAVASKRNSNLVAFWDVDAPSTLDRLEQNPSDPFRALVSRFDLILTYGGGTPVITGYKNFGAKRCCPIYNALDPESHFPTESHQGFEADLNFLGNRLPDREQRMEEFFFKPAMDCMDRSFLLAGNGWSGKARSENIRYLGHLGTAAHNAFYSSALAVLNVCRDSMARYGYSPATRVFEAAGAAACVISDEWAGVDGFFEPEKEILMARDGQEVGSILKALSPAEAKAVGRAARERALTSHTYVHRAADFEEAISS